MRDNAISEIRELPRQHLEDLAIHTLVQLRINKQEAGPNSYFLAVLTGFLMGTVVVGAGFLAGAAFR